MYAINQVKTITIDNQPRPPTAVGRSSVKVNKNAVLFAPIPRSNSNLVISDKANQYCNIINQNTTRMNINNAQDFESNQIKLVISNKSGRTDLPFDDVEDRKLYLSTLLDEYKASFNEQNCDNTNCQDFKLLSYRISQTLLQRISALKSDVEELRTDKRGASQISLNGRPGPRKPLDPNEVSVSSSNYNMDYLGSLHNLVMEKNERIEKLEKLFEDQKRLRLQDAAQVEEKAARIKEWVANKLKELENQNRQLRDQNRKQKETVESLSTKLASMSPISSLRKVNNNSDSVHLIEQSSPIETIDVDGSLRMRKPQLKKTFMTTSSSSEDENQNLKNSSPYRISKSRLLTQEQANEAVIKSVSPNCYEPELNGSPVYDSVAIDLTYRKNNSQQHETLKGEDSLPPPPPLHQSDRWELRLYDLADQTFSSILKQDEKYNDNCDNSDSIDSISNRDATVSRRSSPSGKKDLISLVKPSFTTIDGNNVIEGVNFDSVLVNKSQYSANIQSKLSSCRNSSDQSSQSSIKMNNGRKESFDSHDNICRPSIPSIFDSPMRSRSGKDSILRTQSVKRDPAPEKLYDFIASDLVKRGYLIKPGALKNHNRWFVLKNFYLLSYKSELDEAAKASPNMKLRLDVNCQVHPVSQSNDSAFAFKISYQDKTVQLLADTAEARDEWIRILTVAITLSDIEPDNLTKQNSTYEGIMSVTRQGHTKRCYAALINHVLFFLKSLSDPSPASYISMKGSRIREITDSHDYDLDEQEHLKQMSNIKDCSLAVYPKYSLILDPVYITFESQIETDKWLHFLSLASKVDQSYGTQFERILTKLMVDNSVRPKKSDDAFLVTPDINNPYCLWKEHSVMLYTDRPISEPLTTLSNETLKIEAVEMFKSILLFTQVPMEPVAIDYHVCLLQNCLSRFLKNPELRNEYFAQLIKQFTFVFHKCNRKLSNSSSECSSVDDKTAESLAPTSSECQFLTDVQMLDDKVGKRVARIEANSTLSQLSNPKDKDDNAYRPEVPPTRSEILQVMQILAVSVSLNLPRGRLRWWLIDYLRKFARQDTNIGKYALYALKSIDRTAANGPRDNIPSRTEIMSILLRNPYNHSSPHSLPVNFSDGTYLVIEADGSTTVEEFMESVCKKTHIRASPLSDFYLFSDDPSGSKDLHILEPERKIFDIVGWWEQAFRRHNSGRYENTRAIRLMCKKRLVLRTENAETQQERLLIVHQVNQEVVSQNLPLSDDLAFELCALMAQLTFGALDQSKDPKIFRRVMEKISNSFLPNKSSQSVGPRQSKFKSDVDFQITKRWQELSGKSAQDCIRVYLNCIRRLKFSE